MLFKLLGKHNGPIHTAIFMLCSVAFAYLTFFEFTLTQWLAIFISGSIFTGYTTSGFLHRYCAHRSWKMPRWLEVFLLGSTTALLNQPAMGWSAIHLSHHKHTDKEGDPHGHVHSIWDNFCVFNKVPPLRFVPRWMFKDRLYGFQARWYWETAIVLQAIICLTLGWQVLVSFIALSYLCQIFVNLVGHSKSRMEPRNSEIGAFLWMGEMYHKNHHWNPANPRFGKWDGTYYLLIKWVQMFVSEPKLPKKIL